MLRYPGGVLAIILVFPICSIHLNFSLTLKWGEVSQFTEVSLTPNLEYFTPSFCL